LEGYKIPFYEKHEFRIRDPYDLHGKADYELAVEIICDSIKIEPGNQTYLIVGVDNTHE
jgi:hypothetical protein